MGCTIRQTVAKNAFCIEMPFHHMTEHGYYDGWSHTVVTVTADLAFAFDLSLSVTIENEHNDESFLDYLADTIHHALGQCK